jgi:hypothetical protein
VQLERKLFVQILSIILGVIGGALGGFSILITWKLYQAGTETHLKVLGILSEIHKSSHTAEVTSTHYTERLVGALIELLQRDVTSSLAVAQRDVTQRIDAAITQNLKDIDPTVADIVRSKVHRDIKDTFETLTKETAAAAQLAEPPVGSVLDSKTEPLHPAVMRVIRWVARKEGKLPFLGVRFVMHRIFVDDPVAQQGVQFCIDDGLLELYEVPNPRKAAFPTTALRLNRKHSIVRQIVGDLK